MSDKQKAADELYRTVKNYWENETPGPGICAAVDAALADYEAAPDVKTSAGDELKPLPRYAQGNKGLKPDENGAYVLLKDVQDIHSEIINVVEVLEAEQDADRAELTALRVQLAAEKEKSAKLDQTLHNWMSEENP